MHILRLCLTLIVLSLAAAAAPARADSPMVFVHDGAAISGYDPVAYFTEQRAMPGDADIILVWKGAQWHFVNKRNRALFESNPRAYAPQFGGYCAYGLARGRLVASQPDAWAIHDGKLYLIHNKQVRGLWEQDIPGNLVLADSHWPAVLRQ